MQELFQIKPVELSSTVYSELQESMQEALETEDWRWYGDLCIEAHAALVDAGVLKEGMSISVTRFPTLLQHCHLDAQIPEGES